MSLFYQFESRLVLRGRRDVGIPQRHGRVGQMSEQFANHDKTLPLLGEHPPVLVP